MAKFNAPADFINANVDLLNQRQGSQYARFLESRPTFTTYYHVNKVRSTTDKGLKIPEKLTGVFSPIRYNKINNFPLYGIEQIQLQLDEEDEGLNSDYNGEAIILPNTLHPTVDDYFLIDYLEKPYVFRVTKYDYDTIKSNNYYKIEFTLQSLDVDFLANLEKQVVRNYNTILENVGTDDNVFITDEDMQLADEITGLYDSLAEEYLNMYYKPTADPYNTLLFVAPSISYQSDFDYIFDQNLVHFCNTNAIFYKPDRTDTYHFYEEPKPYSAMEYSNTIYDLFEHYENDRLSHVSNYYELEPTCTMDSIFMYYRDKRVKFLRNYMNSHNVFGGKLKEYLSLNFIDSKSENITDAMEIFLLAWLKDKTDQENLLLNMRGIKPRHNTYTFHNFIFIPLILFALSDLLKLVKSNMIDDMALELANETSVENN